MVEVAAKQAVTNSGDAGCARIARRGRSDNSVTMGEACFPYRLLISTPHEVKGSCVVAVGSFPRQALPLDGRTDDPAKSNIRASY
jgi:hypothetical protein